MLLPSGIQTYDLYVSTNTAYNLTCFAMDNVELNFVRT